MNTILYNHIISAFDIRYREGGGSFEFRLIRCFRGGFVPTYPLSHVIFIIKDVLQVCVREFHTLA